MCSLFSFPPVLARIGLFNLRSLRNDCDRRLQNITLPTVYEVALHILGCAFLGFMF